MRFGTDGLSALHGGSTDVNLLPRSSNASAAEAWTSGARVASLLRAISVCKLSSSFGGLSNREQASERGLATSMMDQFF